MEQSSSTNPDPPCRLCTARAHPWTESLHGISYEWCPNCGVVQRAAADLPSPDAELERYREHNNQPDNQDYRAYLQRFIDSAIVPYVGNPAVGDAGGIVGAGNAARPQSEVPHILDFGSGPFPVLSEMLRDLGYRVTSYDPFFLPDQNALSGTGPVYDAVVMLEVVEHLHQPGQELDRLVELMKPQARLILRTGLFDARDPAEDFVPETPGARAGAGAGAGAGPGAGAVPGAGARPAAPGSAAERFLAWWYRRDPTHVLFLTPTTIAWLETRYSLRLIHRAKGDELVFQREDNT